jgi:hypothetical protein
MVLSEKSLQHLKGPAFHPWEYDIWIHINKIVEVTDDANQILVPVF